MLVGILTPLYSKRISSEFLCLLMIMSMPLLWNGWDAPNPLSTSLMMDKLSLFLTLLSLWTSILMLTLKPMDKALTLNILLLLLSLLLFFSVSSFIFFFILFEASLIPTLCLIMGWGYQPERLEASFYFVFYTILFSSPLLVSILWMIKSSGDKFFFFDNLHEICSGVMGFFVLLVFMIKLPLFMSHFWLPKAHVEAPVVGSMILAGVLLKTGGYGIVRVFSYMEKSLVSSMFMALGAIGMVLVCVVCLYCMDVKQLIAYSSVSHMNFMVVGLMSNSQISYSGSLVMMISHGLCSSLMFMLVDFIYTRTSSRSILVSKGLLMILPSSSMLWAITVLFNMGVPPTAGSISELLIITAGSNSLSPLFVMYLFLSAFYSIYLYMCVNHGHSKFHMNSISVKEVLLGVMHLFPLSGLTLTAKLLL